MSPTSEFFIESLLLPQEKRSRAVLLRVLAGGGIVWWLDWSIGYKVWHLVMMTVSLYLLACEVAREQPMPLPPPEAFREETKKEV